MKFIDLFAGVGGFHYGLEKANKNFKCVWANEWDKYAAEIYKKRFPNTPFFEGDIRTIDVKRLPDFDLLVGGFPCQSFSIAGKRRGFEETRGTLFFEIVRIAKEKRPSLLLLENVKGLLSHDKGRTFATILRTLDEIGYDAEWEVLNSKNFGVPQNRERVFIIGHLRGESGRKIFPIGQSSSRSSEEQRKGERVCYDSQATTLKARDYKGGGNLVQVGRVTAIGSKRINDTPKEINEYLRDCKGNCSNKQIAKDLNLPLTQVEHYFRTDSSRAIPSKKVWFELKELMGFDDTWDSAVCEIEEKEYYFGSSMRVYDSEGLGKTLSANGGGMGAKTGLYEIKACLTPNRPEKRQNGRRFKENGEPMFTLTGQDVHGIEITSHSPRTNDPKLGGSRPLRSKEHCFTIDRTPHIVNRIRRLTPIECERLQGFPDNWTEGLSDTQRYKCMGNAVTTKVVQAIGEKITEVV